MKQYNFNSFNADKTYDCILFTAVGVLHVVKNFFYGVWKGDLF